MSNRVFRLRLRRSSLVAVVDVEGDLDITRTSELTAAVDLLAAAGNHAVVVSFAGVRRFGLAGVRVAVDTCSIAKRHGIAVHVVSPPLERIEVLELVPLAIGTDLYLSTTEAVAAFDVYEKLCEPRPQLPRVA